MANANDRGQVQASSRAEKAARRTELQQIRELMATPTLRRFAARLLDLSGADRAPPFTSNAMALARDHGVQSVGFWLLSEIREACPEQELLMRRESLSLAQRADMTEELANDNRNKPE